MSTKRTRFVQDAKLDPGRYYRHPADIIRDRRLTKEDRLAIVIAWEHATQQLLASAAADGAVEDKLDQLRRLREELEQDLENAGDVSKQDLSS